LGREKALEFIDDQRLIERVITVIRPLCSEVLIVTSKEQLNTIEDAHFQAHVVVDILPGKSSLCGLYTGLKYAKSFYSLTVACDMPFLNHALLAHLIHMAPGYDAIVPRIGLFLEPLHAVYTKNCMKVIENLVENNVFSMTKIFNTVKTRYIDEEEIDRFDPYHLSFFNVNTEKDLREAMTIINNKKGDKQECR
jgi:molybdopterin-guanine dinucleotide biosynthesis protein A